MPAIRKGRCLASHASDESKIASWSYGMARRNESLCSKHTSLSRHLKRYWRLRDTHRYRTSYVQPADNYSAKLRSNTELYEHWWICAAKYATYLREDSPARTAGLLRIPHVLILPQGQNERQCCREFPRWYELRSEATKLRHATTERIHTWKHTSYSVLHQTFVIPKLPETKGEMWQ
jgi:hypothetical protein